MEGGEDVANVTLITFDVNLRVRLYDISHGALWQISYRFQCVYDGVLCYTLYNIQTTADKTTIYNDNMA